MCFEALLNGDTRERTATDVLAGELPDAFRTGVLAGLAVVAVLFAGGASVPLTAGAAVGAVALGTGLQIAVLTVGVGLLRARAAVTAGTDRRPAGD